MTEILTQAQINALLSSITTTESKDNVGTSPKNDSAELFSRLVGVSVEPDSARKIKIFDLRRPDLWSKSQLQHLSAIHEDFCRQATRVLSDQLNCLTRVSVGSVDPLTLQEFIRSVPNPTAVCVLELAPFGIAVMEIEPVISFCVLDRLMLGDGAPSKFSRELTAIEKGLMQSLLKELSHCLTIAWSRQLSLAGAPQSQFRATDIISNPKELTNDWDPHDMVVLITMEVKLGDVEGLMNLALSRSLLRCLKPAKVIAQPGAYVARKNAKVVLQSRSMADLARTSTGDRIAVHPDGLAISHYEVVSESRGETE